ncbi:hypothetical protein [Shewanella waksmanii]|uniref:hypothetical protein n=1 Tax=Shewanella waksmanii TaxID=213783 RepID=UPI0037351D3A
MLEALNGHLAEFVIVENNDTSTAILVRMHPYLALVECEKSALWSDKVLPNGNSTQVLTRTIGQGWRLFSELGRSPLFCLQMLRQGIGISVVSEPSGLMVIAGFEQGWQLIPLENDMRLFAGQKELSRAKAVLSRVNDYHANTEQLLLALSEIDMVCADLGLMLQDHSNTRPTEQLKQIASIDAQLQRKKQWLSQQYQQAVERNNWQYSANQSITDESLYRKLEYYQLLSTPEMNAMVENLLSDEKNS